MSDYIEALMTEAGQQVVQQVTMEDTDIFTLNDHYLQDQCARFKGRLKRAYVGAKELTAEDESAVS